MKIKNLNSIIMKYIKSTIGEESFFDILKEKTKKILKGYLGT